MIFVVGLVCFAVALLMTLAAEGNVFDKHRSKRALLGLGGVGLMALSICIKIAQVMP